jgi:hypothetical protein
MTKNQVKQKVEHIMSMSRDEVVKQATAISMSDVDSKARGFLNRAVEYRLTELAMISPLAVSAEFRGDDLK